MGSIETLATGGDNDLEDKEGEKMRGRGKEKSRKEETSCGQNHRWSYSPKNQVVLEY